MKALASAIIIVASTLCAIVAGDVALRLIGYQPQLEFNWLVGPKAVSAPRTTS